MKLIKYLILVVILALGGLYMTVYTALGTRPAEEELLRISRSPQFEKEKQVFQNRRPGLLKEMRKRAMSFATFKELLSKGKDRSPTRPLPQIKPDLTEFLKPSKDIKVVWFGHSTFLLNLDGKILLVDPVFSQSASPLSFMVKRFQPPALTLEELPKIDLIVLSHDHYDHLDMESIQFFQDKKTTFLTPLVVGSHLVGWGIDRSRITELDWWDSTRALDIEFTATPAQHFSGRDGLHENSTLWASWVIKSKNHSIYFSGDSGYDTHFKEIGDRLGPFDLAFIENGQYNEKWKEVHLLPQDSIQAYFDLRAKRFFPVHWGMFVLAFHPWYEPIENLARAAKEKNINLVTPKLGEIITIDKNFVNQKWWEEFKKD